MYKIKEMRAFKRLDYAIVNPFFHLTIFIWRLKVLVDLYAI